MYTHTNYLLIKDDDNNIISQYDSITNFKKATNIGHGKLIAVLNNNNVNYELIKTLDENLPINKKLNRFTRSAKYFPIAIYDENMNLLAMYTNIALMQKFTKIPEYVGNNASKNIQKYKKRGNKFKKFYYIKKVSFSYFWISNCNIIDDSFILE